MILFLIPSICNTKLMPAPRNYITLLTLNVVNQQCMLVKYALTHVLITYALTHELITYALTHELPTC